MGPSRPVGATYLRKIDVTKSPNQIDISVGVLKRKREHEYASSVNVRLKGIFEIVKDSSDPSKRSLRWCFAMPGEPRPTDFSLTSEKNQTLVVLQSATLAQIANAQKERKDVTPHHGAGFGGAWKAGGAFQGLTGRK